MELGAHGIFLGEKIMIKQLFLISVLLCISLSIAFADTVYLKDGSVIHGKIIEQVPGESIRIQTYDGSIFVFEQGKIDRITYGKVKTPKSGVLAIALSLIFPGIGNFYVGDNLDGTIFLCIGAVSAAFTVYGATRPDKITKVPLKYGGYETERKKQGETCFTLGAVSYLCATASSCATAYRDSKPEEIKNIKVTIRSFSF